MYEINGQEVTLEVLQGKAKEYGMDFDSYLDAMKKKGLVEKTNGSQTEDATAEPENMASSLDNTSSELQDNTVYKAGLLPEVEIEAELDEEKTEQAKSAELADEYMDIVHGVSLQDADVKEAIANSYFNFDAMGSSRFKTERVYSISQKGYVLNRVINDEEQDYKDYFGDSEKGRAKFEKWKKYSETGELDLEGIPNQNIMSGKNSIKNKKAQLFNERLSDEQRDQYEYFLYGDQTVKDTKDEVDFKNTYGRPLVRVETIRGRTYLPSDKARKVRIEDEAKKQNEYLLTASKSIIKEQDKYIKSKKEFDKNPKVLGIRKRFEEIEAELKKIGFVTKDSNPKLIDKYNSLIIEASEINKSFKDLGFEKINLDLIKAAESINSKTQDYYEKAELFNDTQIAKKATTLNYSNTERTALQLEKAFLGGGSVLASSIALGAADLTDYLVDGYNKTKAVEEGVDRESIASISETKLYEYLKNNKKASIDYYRALGGKLEEDFSQNIDFSWENIGVWLPQALANNSPSIVAVGATMGTAGLVTKTMHPLFRGATLAETAANKAIVTKAASKLAQASFFTIAGGQKAGDLEIAQQDAPLIIERLKKAYDEAETNDEKLLIAKQISEQQDALDMSELQKAFSYTVHGGIELFTEKLGSLNAIENFRRFSKITGGNIFARSGRLAADIGVSQVIELGEELTAQVLQNAGEIVIEGKDKSLIEGIDKDFFANTIVTGLAMQGGNIGSNLYNIIKSEVQTAEELSKSHELMGELLEIQNILQTGVGLSSKDRQLVLKRKKEIIKEAALAEVTSVQKLNRLSPEGIELAFELARKRRANLKQQYDLGFTGDVSSFMQKQKDKLLEEFREIEKQRSDLLSKNEKAKLDKAKDLANPAKAVYAAGLNELYTDLAKYSASKSKGEYVDIKDQNLVDMLELFTKKYGNQVAVELVSEYLGGANAGYYKNDIIVFQDNIDAKIYSDQASDIETLIAAVSPMHEALHAKNKEAGIIKDGQLVDAARIATEGIQALLQQKLDQGKITDEAFEAYISRRDELYTTEDGVNAEEMINLVNDLVAIGALNPNDFSNLFGFKTFLNGLAKKLLGDESLFYPLETADDIFGYVKSFQKEFKGSELLLTGEEEESDVKSSKARKTVLEEINTLLPESIKTKEDYNKFLDDPRSFMKLYEATQDDGVISNYVKSRTTNRAEFEEAIDSVIMRLRNFDPSKQRKEGGVVGRGGFGEFVFANTNFSKLDARKALAIKAEQAKETTSLDAEESFVQVADESAAFDEDVEQQPQRKTEGKVIANELNIADKVKSEVAEANIDVDALTNFKSVPSAAPKTVGELLGINPIKLQRTVIDEGTGEKIKNKSFKANLTAGEVASAQRWFNANRQLVIDGLPKGFDIGGQATGVPRTVLDALYTKKETRAKTAAGLKGQVKRTNIKDSEFLALVDIIDGKPNRNRNTSARIIAIADLLSKVITNQEVRQTVPGTERIRSGMSEVMFSKSGKIIASDEMMKVMFSKSQGKRAAEAFGYDHLDLNKEEAKEDLIDWVKNVGSKVMPRSFWEANGNLIGSGAKYKTLIVGGREVKQYSLKGGGTILETDPDFSSYELNLMPEGKMVFANKAQMIEAFKDVEFAPENKNVKDSTKRITLYGKKTGEQVKKLIDKKKDFLNNSDKGFVDTWMAIVKDIDQNPDNRRFWAAWLEVTPQNMSHFMRVGAKLSFYNTLDLKNVEEHTSPATDFAFALWAFANSRDKKGNQILTEALLKKSMESYIQGSLPKIFDNLLKGDGFDYIATIPKEYRLQVIAGEIPVWIRYINDKVNAQKYTLDGVEYSGVNPNVIILANGKTLAQNYGLGIDKRLHFYQGAISTQQDLLFKVFKGEITEANAKKQLDKYVEGTKILKLNTKAKAKMSKAITNVRPVLAYSKTSRGMSTFDFDETLIIDGENFVVATKDGETVKIPSDKWPIDGPRYAAEGYNFDFSDFVNVRGGKEGPLLQKMKNQIKKYGTSNVFVLTARMQDAAEPIHEWLKSKGINIPLENITGLGKSEGDAKAQWFVDKYAEGYNDMYFVDDALPNVEAVKHVFDQLDIKGKSVQARIQFSKGLDSRFNKMLERTKGVGADKRFSRVVAKKRGKNVGRFQFFVPPSADDFAGLLRYFVGKGEQGNADIEFFNEALIKPFARADREMSMLRQAILGDYKKLRKEYKDVKKKLGKMMPNSEFTLDNAIRVYLWNKAGFEIPGLSKRDTENLVARVEADAVTKAFADALGLISRQEKGYSKPGENWNTETIAYDLQNIATKVSRKKFMAEWIENKDEIFTPENLNKIEAVYGTDFREALKDILYRMENGTNRSSNKSYGQGWTNWVNNSVGAIMFFNSRSAVLQTLSMVNFINFEDNNIFKAGKAFANQKQYWSDFSTLFNSDFLKNRRAGLATNVNEAELANAVAGATNKAKAGIGYLLKIGFTPTQIADSFAIASGGATFYRNRISKYTKQGMDQKAAEQQAFLDFQEIAEETQQSARPDRISQQQASPLGRLILAFANTPMQYNRLIKKAAGDLINKRGDWRANVSRILYYGAVQNAIFASLQNAIFALAFDGEEDDEDVLDKKSERVLNSMLDSLLRGSGVAGAAVSTLKNTILEFMAQSERGYKADYGEVLVEALNVSPPMGSKARKLYGALKTYKFNRDMMGEMDTFDYNNPIWDAAGNVTSAAFNIPADRAIRKIDNLREAFNQENSALQRTFLALGWSAWDLNVGEEMIMNKGKSNEYVKLMPLKQKAQYEAEKKMDAREKKEKKAKQQRCTAIKSGGGRCKNMVDKPKTRCHFHD